MVIFFYIFSSYITYSTGAPTIEDSILLFLSSVSLYFRDRALFARLAFLYDHGGQFSDGGRAATDARGGCSVPQLAGPG